MSRHSLRYLVPNALTLMRLLAASTFPWAPESWRLPIIVSALASDLVDGPLSRRLRAESSFGQILDPIADKTFALAVVVVYLLEGDVRWFEIPLVLARDLLVLIGAIWFLFRDGWISLRHMKSRFWGKVTTPLQFVFFLAVFVDLRVMEFLFLAAALAVGLLAALDYFRAYRQGRKSARDAAPVEVERRSPPRMRTMCSC